MFNLPSQSASLGPSVQVLIKAKESNKDEASFDLSHGDIIYLPNVQALQEKYEVRGKLSRQSNRRRPSDHLVSQIPLSDETATHRRVSHLRISTSKDALRSLNCKLSRINHHYYTFIPLETCCIILVH